MYSGPSRKPTRARDFDYRSPGPYFVTICEYHRHNRFGEVNDQKMRLNDAGGMVHGAWGEMATKFPTATFDNFVVMPNHVHGLVTLNSSNPTHNASLTTIVGWFKTMSTNWYMHGVRDRDWPPYNRHLWQRSFHDRIVRNDAEMDRTRTYIANNPALWRQDTFYEPS